jgi:Stress responsive A/B Barrel Domain
MAVRHMAWLKFKDGTPQSRIDAHASACRGLVKSVAVVESLEFGENFSDRADGMTHGIIVSLAERASLDKYLNDPAHVPVAEALVADVAEIKVMDMEY